MKINEIVNIIDGKVICGDAILDTEVIKGFASDLMSDVLTLDADDVLLITGLANLQAIRTAEMSDISCVIIARNKKVTEEMAQLAKECNIILIECPGSVFKTSGKLYEAGIKPIF